jgi:hypothetical protein
VFRRADDLPRRAMALSALADVWDKLGDPAQAAALERRALALHNRLSDPVNRSISHQNLSNYLDRTADPQGSARHDLAALVYRLVTGHGELLKTWRRNFAIRTRRAAAAGGRYELPRLADFLALPELDPLQRFLAEREVDPASLQAEIDALVEEVRSQVAREPAPGAEPG